MIGLGVPKPVLTQTLSANEDQWQQVIRDYMVRAALVVFRIGTSKSLLWEVCEATRLLSPVKIMLLIGDPQVYNEFHASAAQLFPKGLPAHVKTKGGPLSDIQAVVYFEQDWTPRFIPLVVPSGRGQPLERALVLAMRPIYAQLGVPWQPPQTFWSSLTGATKTSHKMRALWPV
jgi:hypothetical protein